MPQAIAAISILRKEQTSRFHHRTVTASRMVASLPQTHARKAGKRR
jgi:hypothetical protein